MEFEYFTQARDFYYAAVVCLGLSLGCLTRLIPSSGAPPNKNRRITGSLCFFASAVAFFATALVKSQGSVQFISFLLIPSGILGSLSIAAVRFPRAVAFPLIILMGLLTVWLGYSVFRFPAIAPSGTAVVSVFSGLNDRYWVYPNANEQEIGQIALPLESIPSTGDLAALIPVEDADQPLVARLSALSFDPRYPLIGAKQNGAITQVRQGAVELFSLPGLPWAQYPTSFTARALQIGIALMEYEIPLPLDVTGYGLLYIVYFNGSSYSIQIARGE